jgi:hypothetical protein
MPTRRVIEDIRVCSEELTVGWKASTKPLNKGLPLPCSCCTAHFLSGDAPEPYTAFTMNFPDRVPLFYFCGAPWRNVQVRWENPTSSWTGPSEYLSILTARLSRLLEYSTHSEKKEWETGRSVCNTRALTRSIRFWRDKTSVPSLMTGQRSVLDDLGEEVTGIGAHCFPALSLPSTLLPELTMIGRYSPLA